MPSFVNTFTFNTNIIAAAGQVTTAKNGVLIGHRTTGGELIVANAGYPQPSIYEPLVLPPFTDGNSALSYMQNLGFNVAYGVMFNLALPAPTTATLQLNGQWQLTWSTVPSGFAALTNIAISGIITQGVNTANVNSATIVSNTAVMVVTPIASSTFNNSTVITLAGINNNNYPDPTGTDEICMGVWYYYQSAVSLPRSTNGQPAAVISILSDRDTTNSPNATPFNLVAPTSVSVVGTTTTLVYPIAAANLGYLPINQLGATSFTQATSTATGTYAGMTIGNTTVSITIANTVGVFDTTHTVAVVLDSTQNVFSYLKTDDIEINNVVMPYEITSSAGYTTYSDFFTGISVLNNGTFVIQNKYYVEGLFGNCSTLAAFANTLPIYNSMQIKQVSYPYVQKFLDIPMAAYYIACAQAYVNNNSDIPYYPQDGVWLSHIPISSDTQNVYSVTVGGTADVAINQGWLPWSVNNQGQAYIVRDVTSLTTIPNTSIPDIEFRFERIPAVIRYITKDIYQQWQIASVVPTINGGRVLNSPFFQQDFKNIVIGRLYLAQDLNLVTNVAAYADLVTVVTNPSSPTGILVTIPAQIIPGVGSANVTLNIFSVYSTFTTTA